MTYCETGIDVRQYAMANQDVKRAAVAVQETHRTFESECSGQGGIPSAPAGGPPPLPPRVEIENANGSRATVLPRVAGLAPVILAVEDSGTPRLTSYRRVILRMQPAL